MSDLLGCLQLASPASSIRRHVATRLGTATTTRLILSHSHSTSQARRVGNCIILITQSWKSSHKGKTQPNMRPCRDCRQEAKSRNGRWSRANLIQKKGETQGTEPVVVDVPFVLYANQVRINVERCTISTFLT